MIVNPNPNPITRMWRNGVRETQKAGTTTYHLPGDTLGVAREITVKPRLFGLLGASLSASDSKGNPLQANTEWHGFHRVYVTHDPATGLRTELDPKEHNLAAGTPRQSTVESKLGNLQVASWTQEIWQTRDAVGNSVVRNAAEGREKTALVKHVPVVLMKDESFVETRLGPDGGLTSELVRVNENGCTHGAALATSSDGKLVSIDRGNGEALQFPLYFGGLA